MQRRFAEQANPRGVELVLDAMRIDRRPVEHLQAVRVFTAILESDRDTGGNYQPQPSAAA